MTDKASAVAQEILYSGRHLPQMPENGPELLRMSRQPVDTIDVDRLTALIEADPGMTARLLRLANSAYYGTVKKIFGLHQAIMHIGLEETFNTVCYLLYKDALPVFPRLEGFSDREYWAHSWACATAARMLGHPRLGIGSVPGELYIAGLLQGIGKLMLALHKPDAFLESIKRSRDASQPLWISEFDVLGTNDGYVAAAVLEAWRLPETICMAVRYYHNPEEADHQHREIAGATQFAYYLANISGIGSAGDQYCTELGRTWIANTSSLPLSQTSIRDSHVSRILTHLHKKSTLLDGNTPGKQTDAQTGENGRQTAAAETTASSATPKKAGLFSRLMAYVRYLFS